MQGDKQGRESMWRRIMLSRPWLSPWTEYFLDEPRKHGTQHMLQIGKLFAARPLACGSCVPQAKACGYNLEVA